MYIQSPALGAVGIVPDQPDTSLPIGAWSNGLNVRFNDQYAEVIVGPRFIVAMPTGTLQWAQLYEDEVGPRVAVTMRDGANDKLYRLNLAGTAWDDVSGPTALGNTGNWQSFQWGQAVVFNNGISTPQILLPNTTQFKDLANWGNIGGSQKTVTAAVIRPFRNVMMAINITTDGTQNENEIIWSDPAFISNDVAFDFEPSWDYEDATARAGRNYVGVDKGPLVDLLDQGNRMVLYTSVSTHLATPIGGRTVFRFDDAQFEYGIIALGAVTSFGNQHFCISPKAMYIHDGQRVDLVGEGRVDKSFYGQVRDLFKVFVEEDVARKEIHIVYNTTVAEDANERRYLIYNYKDNTWSNGQAFGTNQSNKEQVVHMAYGLVSVEGSSGTSWDDLGATTWSGLTGTSWGDLGGTTGTSSGRVMYWFTERGLWLAEADDAARDTNKTYFIEHTNVDFSELDPSLNTSIVKHISQIVPHIDTAVGGGTPADCSFNFNVAYSLKGSSGNTEMYPFSVENEQYKVDTRVTGRWISMRIDITGDGQWRLSTMDYDMEAIHGR